MTSTSPFPRMTGPLAVRAAVVSLALATVPTTPLARLGAQVPGAPRVVSADSVLTLGAAARLATTRSAGSQAARYRVGQAAARVRQSRAALLPEVQAVAGRSGRTFNTATFGIQFPTTAGQPPLFDPNGQVEGPVQLWDFRGRISANLLDLGAFSRIKAAQSLERASDAEAANQAELAATQAATAYLRALRAQGQYRARAADSALAADLLGIAREQLRAGTGVALDVTRAQSQLAATRAQLIVARNESDRAELELRRTLDLPLDTPLRLADSLPALPSAEGAPSESEAVSRALAHRPDLRAAAAQLDAARRQVSAIRAERLPTVSGFYDQGVIGLDLSHLLNTYDFGLQVGVPIFNGFRRQGRQQEQEAVAAEFDVRRRDLLAQAAVEVRGSLLDLSSAREQVGAATERQLLAEQELSQARDRFRAGVAGNADVITAALSLNAARTARVDALTAYQSARVSLARAQGALTELP